MTDKEKTIKELKEVLDNLDITNKYRLNLIRAIEYLQEETVSEDYRESYKNIAQSDAFKSAYKNKSLGDVMSVEGEEPVSEDIEEVSKKYALNNTPYEDCTDEMSDAFKAGANYVLEEIEKKLDEFTNYEDSLIISRIIEQLKK